MRLTFTACVRRLLLLVPLFLCSILLANDSQDGEKITLFEKAVPLKVVFKKITSQTGIKFVYSNRLIDDEQKVDVSVRNANLEEVMQQIFVGKKFELQRTSAKSVVLIVHEKVVSVNELKAEPVSKKRTENVFFDLTGMVTDTAGGAIPGATVLVRGTNMATATNGEGRFYLQNLKRDMVLLVSSIGFQSKEIKVGNDEDLIVKLTMAVNNLDESVITAYGATTQHDNVGAITVVRGKDIEALPNRSFDRSLQGLVPGLLVTKGTGQPGGGVSNMVLRGISTGGDVGSGATLRNPLFVIDGVPVTQDNFQLINTTNATPVTNPLAQLNPSDIESISVLKDAVAVALYGSKASNGVILINTKRGRSGKTLFSFRHQTDWASKLIGKVEVLDQEQYLKLASETLANTNPYYKDPQRVTDTLRKLFPVRRDGSFYPATNWYDEIFVNRSTTMSNEVSMSGGNEKSNFYLNLEYTKQNGIVKGTGYDRKSLRFNFEHRPASYLKFGVNTTFSYNDQTYDNAAETLSSYGAAAFLSPLNPVRLEDGSYKLVYTAGSTSAVLHNPVAISEYNINRNIAYRGLGNVFGEVKFLKYLTFKSNVGVDFMLAELKQKLSPVFYTPSTLPQIIEKDVRRTSVISTNTLQFDKSISTHHMLSVVLGQEAQVNDDKNFEAAAQGTADTDPYYNQVTSPGYTISKVSSTYRKQTLLSLFGQVNYNFRRKYFLSSSMRRDGSSKFGDQEQWGTYWSAGGGWIVTAEEFMKGSATWLNHLKIRGSFGVAGNSGVIDDFTRFDRIGKRRYLNGYVVVPAGLGNPDIRWEQTFSWDAGIEAKFWQQRISLTADIYKKKTRDLIYVTSLPSVAGASSILDNIGNMENKGVELSLSADIIRRKSFRWNLSGNWSTNDNVLVKANVPLAAVSGGVLGNEEGRNFNSFYMPVWAGVNTADGKPQWLDNAGKPTSTYSMAKKEFVGKPQPDGFGSMFHTFSYKSIDLTAIFYYQYGAKIYDQTLGTSLLSDGTYPFVNQVKQALDYWKKPGDVATNPRRLMTNSDRGTSSSTRFLFKGDYIRLSNVRLTYNFPQRILTNWHVNSLRAYLQANNLALLTNYSGPDPDNVSVGGTTGYGYPKQKTFTAGVNVSF